MNAHLLQNASHDPFAFTACKFLPSFTSTCSDPLPVADADAAPDDDVTFMLPNLRKPRLPPELLPDALPAVDE